MLKTLKLNRKLSTPYGVMERGKKIKVETDRSGLPLDLFWRKRLKDSEIDDCVSLVEEKQHKKKKK
jgi:hypothetical protein